MQMNVKAIVSAKMLEFHVALTMLNIDIPNIFINELK